MGRRHRARELAIQVLFHLEYTPGDPEEAFDLVCTHFDLPSASRGFARTLVLGVHRDRDILDDWIREASRNWRVERMSKVDRNILRLGAFELAHEDDIPAKVSIDEAVELGKKYGSEESGAFINGILDTIASHLEIKKPLD